jgi:hypothetical protein
MMNRPEPRLIPLSKIRPDPTPNRTEYDGRPDGGIKGEHRKKRFVCTNRRASGGEEFELIAGGGAFKPRGNCCEGGFE